MKTKSTTVEGSVSTSQDKGVQNPERWVWKWAGFLTLLAVGNYASKRDVLLHSENNIVFFGHGGENGPRIWDGSKFPMLIIMLLMILVIFLISSWWRSWSKLRSRRSPLCQFIGYFLFSYGTFSLSFGATGQGLSRAIMPKAWPGLLGNAYYDILCAASSGDKLSPFSVIFDFFRYNPIPCILICAAIIATGYFLVFGSASASRKLASPA
jgi:hypothetical protein